MAMYCKKCLKFINEANPEFCPHCGHPQKERTTQKSTPFYRKPWFLILIAVLLVSIIFGGNSTPEIVNAGNTVRENNIAAPLPMATTQPVSGSNYFKVGETAKLNNVYVTFANAYESKGIEFSEPSPGNVFIVCEFSIDNQSPSELNISSLMCFEAYVDDYSINSSFDAEYASGKSSLDGTVASGKKMKGVIGYEVPSNWRELEIRFTPDFWSLDDDFIFVYKK